MSICCAGQFWLELSIPGELDDMPVRSHSYEAFEDVEKIVKEIVEASVGQ